MFIVTILYRGNLSLFQECRQTLVPGRRVRGLEIVKIAAAETWTVINQNRPWLLVRLINFHQSISALHMQKQKEQFLLLPADLKKQTHMGWHVKLGDFMYLWLPTLLK